MGKKPKDEFWPSWNDDEDKDEKEDEQQEYEVGYGKPPRAHQFRKGQSGNPKGRPKRKPAGSILAAILQELDRTIEVSVGGEPTTLNTKEVIARKFVQDGVNGTPHQRRMFAKMLKELGMVVV